MILAMDGAILAEALGVNFYIVMIVGAMIVAILTWCNENIESLGGALGGAALPVFFFGNFTLLFPTEGRVYLMVAGGILFAWACCIFTAGARDVRRGRTIAMEAYTDAKGAQESFLVGGTSPISVLLGDQEAGEDGFPPHGQSAAWTGEYTKDGRIKHVRYEYVSHGQSVAPNRVVRDQL
jgi:hypothetical protein